MLLYHTGNTKGKSKRGRTENECFWILNSLLCMPHMPKAPTAGVRGLC